MSGADSARYKQALAAIAATERAPIVDWEHEQALAKVRGRALLILNARRRSRFELHQRLIDAEFDPGLVAEVLDGFERSGLINDLEFASEWVRQRAARRGKSRAALEQELIQKGVAATVRQQALEQISSEDEFDTALAVARKSARKVHEIPADFCAQQRDLRRIVGACARRGFSGGLAMQVATQALEERLSEIDAS